MSVHLNRRVTLEESVGVADGAGGFTQAWAPLGTLWASIKAGSGRERFVAGVTRSSVPHQVTVRAARVGASDRPKPDQRFREGERVFRILAVAESDAQGRYLVCHTVEEVAG